MSDRVNIKVHTGEEIEAFTAMPDRWIKMIGNLVEIHDSQQGASGYYALVFAKDGENENLIQMGLVSLVSGTKLGSVETVTYEEAMQSRSRFVIDTIEAHIKLVGSVHKLNVLHAYRLAQIIAEIGPQQEKIFYKKKKKKKGRVDE